MTKSFIMIICVLFMAACIKEEEKPQSDKLDWQSIRQEAKVTIHLSDEYSDASYLSLSDEAWEDGIFITRDGLDIYCIYSPADVMSFSFAGAPQEESDKYFRGNPINMDMTFADAGYESWIHADIYRSSRTSTEDDFFFMAKSKFGRCCCQ